ncbi:MAG: sensor domain-containing diguanylate cyclase [Proteobacteria bacterium]|nr:sensor domain-containing diguanylate cyclase [Pseudomonadota bacterium]
MTTQILDAASNGIIAVDADGKVVFANSAAGDLMNRDAAAMAGVNVERLFVFGGGHLNAGRPLPLLAQIRGGPYYLEREAHLARSDGESFEAVYTVAPFRAGREIVGYVITFRDVTERRRAEAELRLAGAVFEYSPDGLIVADANGRVTKSNPAYRRVTNLEEAEIVGQPLGAVLNHGAQGGDGALPIEENGEDAQWEQWCKSKTGRRYAARISLSAVRDADGVVQQYIAIVSDVTQRKLDEEKIIYQANYDQLTGLPNRTLFMDRLTRRVLEGKRAKTSVGLMFIDLDGFKAINDTMGHDAGDLLLKSTARRLEKSVREADTVARLGGDEFTVIMPLIDNFEAAAVVAQRIIKSLTEPFDLAGREGRISASIGISLLPAQATTASQLLHNADVAMYFAKRQGKANYQLYRPDLEDTVQVQERAL